ncbi:MAG TPA: DUF805 domain-containing protein [Acetobacteraceae bacterium]|nr:DUF805 domain-containing protein [Acetobacteraceae bacterium]
MSKPVTEDLFRFSGRRNRKSYIFYLILFTVIMIAIWTVAMITGLGTGSYAVVVLAILLSLPIILSGWAVGSQRCRDFGWTGWAMLLTLIPYVGWLFAVAILFVPGTQGVNRYGPDPIPSRVSV